MVHFNGLIYGQECMSAFKIKGKCAKTLEKFKNQSKFGYHSFIYKTFALFVLIHRNYVGTPYWLALRSRQEISILLPRKKVGTLSDKSNSTNL